MFIVVYAVIVSLIDVVVVVVVNLLISFIYRIQSLLDLVGRSKELDNET